MPLHPNDILGYHRLPARQSTALPKGSTTSRAARPAGTSWKDYCRGPVTLDDALNEPIEERLFGTEASKQ